MTEEQADKTIELLESIANNTKYTHDTPNQENWLSGTIAHKLDEMNETLSEIKGSTNYITGQL